MVFLSGFSRVLWRMMTRQRRGRSRWPAFACHRGASGDTPSRARVSGGKRGRPRSTSLLPWKRRRPELVAVVGAVLAPIPEAMTYTPAEFSRIGLIDKTFYGKSAEGGFEGTCYQKQSLRSDRPRDLVHRPKHQDNDRRLDQ